LQRGNSNTTRGTPNHAPQPLQVWSKSGSNTGHFNLEGQTVLRPYHASHGSGVTETSQLGIPPLAPQIYCKFGHNRAVMTGTLPLMPKHIFVRISPRLSAGEIKHHKWHSLPMRHNQGYFGKNWAVNPILFWAILNTQNMLEGNIFLNNSYIHFKWVLWKRHTLHFLHTPYDHCKFGRNQSVLKDTLLMWVKQFFATISNTTGSE
jgi:hypothetical protein